MGDTNTNLLVIDVGNTNTVLGVFKDTRLLAQWRLTTNRAQTADEYGILIRNLFAHEGIQAENISAIMIASVVPPLNTLLEDMAQKYFHIKVLFLGPGVRTGMAINYDNPQDVGADRIANGVAAFEKYGGPCVIVDFGTAITFDAVSERGEYLGGVIAPGIGVASEALFQRAARLPISSPSSRRAVSSGGSPGTSRLPAGRPALPRTLLTSLIPAAVIATAWLRLENPINQPLRSVAVAGLAVLPALVRPVGARVVAVLLSAGTAASIAYGVSPLHPRHVPGAIWSRFSGGFLDFYDVRTPFDPRVHAEMRSVLLTAVFGFALAVALAVDELRGTDHVIATKIDMRACTMNGSSTSSGTGCVGTLMDCW